MSYFYLIAHFALMLLWVLPAFYLNYRLLRNYPDGAPEEKLTLLKNVQSISDKTELPASSFIFLIGVLMILDNTFFLQMGIIHFKILLALIAIGLYHMSRGRLRRIITSLEGSGAVAGQGRQLIFFRVITLVLIVSVGVTYFHINGLLRQFI
jgi:uncharacterized membrane protein